MDVRARLCAPASCLIGGLGLGFGGGPVSRLEGPNVRGSRSERAWTGVDAKKKFYGVPPSR